MVEMDRFGDAWAVLDACVQRGVPGVAAAVWWRGRVIGPVTRGAATPDGAPVTERSRFAVASATKVVTALAVLRLVDRGDLDLETPVRDLIPGAFVDPTARLRHLLCHTSGLPLDVESALAPYQPGLTLDTLLDASVATPSVAAVGERVIYSNAGYGLLAFIVNRITGRGYVDAMRELVLAPLKMTEADFDPPADGGVARVIDVRGGHATELEPYNSPFWRSLVLPWGGMFSSPVDLLALAAPFLGEPIGGVFLSPGLAARAIANQTDGLAGGGAPLVWDPCPWGLGWELRDAKTPHWGASEASPESFGHAGAAGTVLWADPTRGVAWALCGNRTADNGWLVRQGPAFGNAVIRAVSAGVSP